VKERDPSAIGHRHAARDFERLDRAIGQISGDENSPKHDRPGLLQAEALANTTARDAQIILFKALSPSLPVSPANAVPAVRRRQRPHVRPSDIVPQ
jgi:hypothetical protein